MAQARISRSRLVFVILVILCAGALAAVLLVGGGEPLRYTVVFDEREQLAEGAAVVLDGQTIGTVETIKPSTSPGGMEVELRIKNIYRERIHQPPHTTARIRDNDSVEIINRGGTGKAIAEGTRVEGINSLLHEQDGSRATKSSRLLTPQLSRDTNTLGDWKHGRIRAKAPYCVRTCANTLFRWKRQRRQKPTWRATNYSRP